MTASSLKCYTGYEGNVPGIPEVSFKETSCPPNADVCWKQYTKNGEGYFATVKYCSTSFAALAMRIKTDECVVGFEANCRRKIGLRSQKPAVARKTNITNLISRSAAEEFVAQQCKKVGTAHANQGNEMAACFCTGNLCNSASTLSSWIFPILIIFFIFSVM